MEEAKWYVAHTFSGYENKVASNIQTVVENRNLHDLIQEVSVPTETVVEIKEEVKKLGVEKISVEIAYAEGDLVNVIDGPLEGFSGTVDSVDVNKNSVQVTISMFGRETAVEFELDQLEKVKD